MAVVQLPNTYIYKLSAEGTTTKTTPSEEAVRLQSAQGQEDQAPRPYHEAGGGKPTRSEGTRVNETLQPITEGSQLQETVSRQLERSRTKHLRGTQIFSPGSSLENRAHKAEGDLSRRSRAQNPKSKKGVDKGKCIGTFKSLSSSSDRSKQRSDLFLSPKQGIRAHGAEGDLSHSGKIAKYAKEYQYDITGHTEQCVQ